MKRQFALLTPLLLAVGCLVGCAKKMMPPSPDRFAPSLVEVESRSRAVVDLVFDEEVSADKVSADSVVVTDADGARLAVRSVSSGRTEDRVTLWAPFVGGRQYVVRAAVLDRAGNIARIRARFVASTRVDTIAPRAMKVVPDAGSTVAVFGAQIRLQFSEAMDTTGGVQPLVAPRQEETLFAAQWEKDWQSLRLSSRDSLLHGRLTYVLVDRGLADLEGNRLRAPAFTYFTPDSGLVMQAVRGRVVWKSTRLRAGVVFFENDSTPGLAPILDDGTFTTRLLPGTYSLTAVADTDRAGRAELTGSLTGFNPAVESIIVNLVPETLPRPFDSYRR